jgi:hypothetical protein
LTIQAFSWKFASSAQKVSRKKFLAKSFSQKGARAPEFIGDSSAINWRFIRDSSAIHPRFIGPCFASQPV